MFGRLAVVVANAAIDFLAWLLEMSEAQWESIIDVNLTGVWKTVRASARAMVDAGNGGSIALIGSVAAMSGFGNIGHYVASKHGLVGLMKSLAIELAPHDIRVNCVSPANVHAPMIIHPMTYRHFRSDPQHPTDEDVLPTFRSMNLLDRPMLDPVEISNAVLYLASDDARSITGVCLPVDLGLLTK